jgi:aminopeptidase-like protein
MRISEAKTALLKEPEILSGMRPLMEQLYPICRSITGQGVRDTLAMIGSRIGLDMVAVPTGTQAFDWTVPKEWNVKEAYIKGPSGETVVDFARLNLHLVNYSAPFRGVMSLSDLKPHLHSLPEHPDWVPYRTSYYSETWGFCLSHNQLQSLPEGSYEVVVDTSLGNGVLNYGEYLVQGETEKEVLFSCHICHPSLGNDNLSGIAVATSLADMLTRTKTRLSYRFLFIPGTIGSIVWLSRNEERVSRIVHGLVLTCIGDAGGFTYKRSRRGDSLTDRYMEHALRRFGVPSQIQDFSPYGYDERQFCSPGFDLPVGCLMRTPHGCYPEYHTSADNLEFVKQQSLEESLRLCLDFIDLAENDAVLVNQSPKCEPQLGRRGLYKAVGGQHRQQDFQMAVLWILNQSDGQHSLLDIAERSGIDFATIRHAAERLRDADLLRPAGRA